MQMAKIAWRVNRGVRINYETWWTRKAKEVEEARKAEDVRRLLQLIHATGPRESPQTASPSFTGADGWSLPGAPSGIPAWSITMRFCFSLRCSGVHKTPTPRLVTEKLENPEINRSLQNRHLENLPDGSISDSRGYWKQISKTQKCLSVNLYSSVIVPPVPDDLLPGLFKHGVEFLGQCLSSQLVYIWVKETVPYNLGESMMVPIIKKDTRSECSLTPVVTRLLASLIHRLTVWEHTPAAIFRYFWVRKCMVTIIVNRDTDIRVDTDASLSHSDRQGSHQKLVRLWTYHLEVPYRSAVSPFRCLTALPPEEASGMGYCQAKLRALTDRQNRTLPLSQETRKFLVTCPKPNTASWKATLKSETGMRLFVHADFHMSSRTGLENDHTLSTSRSLPLITELDEHLCKADDTLTCRVHALTGRETMLTEALSLNCVSDGNDTGASHKWKERAAPEEHHTSPSLMKELNCTMIDGFPPDYMHRVCLGLVRKPVTLLRTVPSGHKARLTLESRNLLNDTSEQKSVLFSADFPRKCRGAVDLDWWKAFELRRILLYIGPVVLRDILHPEVYECFTYFTSSTMKDSYEHLAANNGFTNPITMVAVKRDICRPILQTDLIMVPVVINRFAPKILCTNPAASDICNISIADEPPVPPDALMICGRLYMKLDSLVPTSSSQAPNELLLLSSMGEISKYEEHLRDDPQYAQL
ncbi:hypothetical protein CLF_108310, partial [Clonorchis sinensis]